MPFDPPGAHASATFDVPPQPGEGQCSVSRLSPDSDPGDGGGLTGALADDEVVVGGDLRRGRIVAGQAVEEQLYGVLGDLGLAAQPSRRRRRPGGRTPSDESAPARAPSPQYGERTRSPSSTTGVEDGRSRRSAPPNASGWKISPSTARPSSTCRTAPRPAAFRTPSALASGSRGSCSLRTTPSPASSPTNARRRTGAAVEDDGQRHHSLVRQVPGHRPTVRRTSPRSSSGTAEPPAGRSGSPSSMALSSTPNPGGASTARACHGRRHETADLRLQRSRPAEVERSRLSNAQQAATCVLGAGRAGWPVDGLKARLAARAWTRTDGGTCTSRG